MQPCCPFLASVQSATLLLPFNMTIQKRRNSSNQSIRVQNPPALLTTNSHTNPYIFGFPLVLLVPLAPLSSPVTSVSDVSAFKLTGSPSCEGFDCNLSCARCLSDFSLWSLLAPRSSGVGFVSEVSARRDTGSPSWDGLVSFLARARDERDLLSFVLLDWRDWG